MSYTITKSNGGTLIVLGDGLTDDSVTSLTLVGKDVSGYGLDQNENYVYLLENFAKSSAAAGQPRAPLAGQVWFDTNSNNLRPMVYDGTYWRPIAVSIVGSTSTDVTTNASSANSIPFAAYSTGDYWFNTTSNQLYVFTATNQYELVGPEAVAGFATTKMSSTSVLDSGGNPHPVIEAIINGEVVSIISNDSFIPQGLVGYPEIYRGVTFKNYNSSTRYTTATTDVLLYGMHQQLDQTIPRTVVSENIQANWTFNDGAVLNFGISQTGSIGYNTQTTYTQITSTNGVALVANNSSVIYDGVTLYTTSSNSIGSTAHYWNSSYITSGTFITSTANTVNANNLFVSALSANTATCAQLSANSATAVNLQGSTANYTTITATYISAQTVSAQNSTIVALTATNANISALITNTQGITTALSDKSNSLATTEFVQSLLPYGSIIMWYGAVNAVPSGWALCNGSNGTPNLTDKFVLGAGNSYEVGATGGYTDTQVIYHTHETTVITDDGGHDHTINYNGSNGVDNMSASGGGRGTNQGGSNNASAAPIYINTSSSNIDVSVTVLSTGTVGSNLNMPPYYAVAYIMKVFG